MFINAETLALGSWPEEHNSPSSTHYLNLLIKWAERLITQRPMNGRHVDISLNTTPAGHGNFGAWPAWLVILPGSTKLQGSPEIVGKKTLFIWAVACLPLLMPINPKNILPIWQPPLYSTAKQKRETPKRYNVRINQKKESVRLKYWYGGKLERNGKFQ